MAVTKKHAQTALAMRMSAATVKRSSDDDLKVYGISMIRNDADLMSAILNQAKELFDHYVIVDVQSTDGTSEVIEAYSKIWPHITHLKVRFEEKHQGAMMTALAQEAVDAGADWVFFIDGDEFLHVDGRADLQHYLKAFPFDVMHLPWINLVPSNYGVFEKFDVDQEFRWSGRVHELNKVAVSSAFVKRNPSFNVHEGNHTISRTINMHDSDWNVNSGIPLLHIPVRSAERLRYKVKKALATLLSKHNVKPGEGMHVIRMAELLSAQQPNLLGLNAISASYSMQHERTGDLDVVKLGWPVKHLPEYCLADAENLPSPRSSRATSNADSMVEWKETSFAKNSLLRAYVDDQEIQLAALPIAGGEIRILERYPALAPPKDGMLNAAAVARAIEASIKASMQLSGAHSAILSAFLAFEKPRRFVDLVAGSGSDFMEMCMLAQEFASMMECVAVGSWDGKRPGYDQQGFVSITQELATRFPEHQLIRAHAEDATACFTDGSIDLLRLPRDVPYAELSCQLELWRPKLAVDAVVLMPQINEHGGESGTWRLWGELDADTARLGVPHDGGLGFFMPASQSVSEQRLFPFFSTHKELPMFINQYLSSLGQVVKHSYSTERPNLVVERVEDTSRIEVLSETLHHATDRAILAERLALKLWQEKIRNTRKVLRSSDKNLSKEMELIQDSGMFNREYYLQNNDGARESGIDPILHYVSFGVEDLRMPNEWFNPADYLIANHDVMLETLDPFLHFILYGRSEGRSLS
jgi:hypothetical protein